MRSSRAKASELASTGNRAASGQKTSPKVLRTGRYTVALMPGAGHGFLRAKLPQECVGEFVCKGFPSGVPGGVGEIQGGRGHRICAAAVGRDCTGRLNASSRAGAVPLMAS